MAFVEFFIGANRPNTAACDSRGKLAASATSFPRLSIGYLLLLTLILGFVLAWSSPYIRPLLSYSSEQLPGGKWLYIATRLAESTILGVQLFGLIVIAQQWWRGARWRLAPGHWYFVVT